MEHLKPQHKIGEIVELKKGGFARITGITLTYRMDLGNNQSDSVDFSEIETKEKTKRERKKKEVISPVSMLDRH